MRVVKFDSSGDPPTVYAGVIAVEDLGFPLDPECAVMIVTADTAALVKPAGPFVIPPAPGWVQLNFPVTEVCARIINRAGGATAFTPGIAGVWDLNVGVEGPAIWSAPNEISLAVFKNGALYRRLERRRFTTADLEFFIAGSCGVLVNGTTDVLSVRLQQTGATPLGFTAWNGWWDMHWTHGGACSGCLP